MENFCYDGKFYSDIEQLMSDFDFEEDHLEDIDDDWQIECRTTELEPVVTLSPDWIMNAVNEERFSEDGNEYDKIYTILKDNIDFDKVNALMPKMYYESRIKFKLVKQDIVDYCK